MGVNFDSTSIILATIGGIIMSIATSLNLYLTGRITGWSGIFYGISSLDKSTIIWKSSVICGAITAGCIAWIIQTYNIKNDYVVIDAPTQYTQGLDVFGWIISGFLVGLGTKLGNGCTSGHGVCGLPRFSIRSYVAVAAFLTTAISIATIRFHAPFLNTSINLDAIYDQGVVAGISLALAIAYASWNYFYLSNGFEKKRDTAISYFTGLTFGGALVLSGMTRRAKVLGFLSIGEGWDPSLAFVLGGAVLPNFISFWKIIKQGKPLYSDHFELPKNNKVDFQLIIGAMIFGLGWGIGGLCPGPAIVIVGVYTPQLLITFIPFLIIGQRLGNYIQIQWNKSNNDSPKRILPMHDESETVSPVKIH